MRARRTILIGTVLLLGVACAQAQTIRFFVNEDTNRIDESTSFDRVAVPTGYTAVAKTVIDAACSCESAMGGFWEGTAYKLPESQKPTTDAGMLRKALRLFRVRLEAMIDDLPRASRHWSAESAAVVHNLFAYAPRGVRGVVLSTEWTTTQKLAFLDKMSTGALDADTAALFLQRVKRSQLQRRPTRHPRLTGGCCGSTLIPG